MKNREAWITSTMIELSDTSVSDFNLIELLNTLAARYAELFKATDVGIVIADEQGMLYSMAFSMERMRVLDLLELQHGDGPCIECIPNGAPVRVTLLDDAAIARCWPNSQTATPETGYQPVLALALRLRDTTIGAVEVFLDDPRGISPADVQLAKALADIATIRILQERVVRHSAIVAEQLQGALDSRVVIEQAKGILAERHGISVDEAFHRLRDHARSHNHCLTDVARSIANHQFALDQFSVEHRSERVPAARPDLSRVSSSRSKVSL